MNKEILNIQIISYRWIDYCLSTKYIIKDPFEKKLVNLLPINNVTPFPHFDQFYMYYDDNQDFNNRERKKILKDLVKIIGSHWEKSEYFFFIYLKRKITHLISDNKNSIVV